MSLNILAWSRDDLSTACLRLSASARTLEIAALLPLIEATEAAQSVLAAAEASHALAEAAAAQASRDFAPRLELTIACAQTLLLTLRVLAAEGVEGADLLLSVANRTWSVRDRKARGAAALAPLRALVATLTLAAPSPAAARVADALDRLNAATEALGQSLDARDTEHRDRLSTQTDRSESDRVAREALSALRRAVAWELGGENAERYLRWKAPVAGLGRRARRVKQPAPAK